MMQGNRMLFHGARQILTGFSYRTSGFGKKAKVSETPKKDSVSKYDVDSKVDEFMLNCRRAQRKLENYFDFWFWLVKFGMRKDKIIRMRRKMKKFAYPWLVFALPAGIYMFIGDGIAQFYMEKEKLENYNIIRSLHYGAIGLFITGPLTSKWSLFWLRKLPRHPRTFFMASSLLLDILLLTPMAVMITMVAFDYQKASEKWNKPNELFKERYKQCFKEIMLFYIQTRPILGLASCFILPKPIGKFLRPFYYIWFYSVMSHAFTRHKLGPYVEKKGSKRKS